MGESCAGVLELSLCLGTGAGMGEVEVVIQDPTGQKGTVEPQLEARGDSTYRCSYQPTMEGYMGVPKRHNHSLEPITVAFGEWLFTNVTKVTISR